jgi:hypothetical protein
VVNRGQPARAGLSAAEAAATAEWIASVQLPSGMIPWYPGGHADAWNHTEAAMALVLAGRRQEAEAAYEWLRSAQEPDGSWCLYHLAEGIEEPRRDPNVGAYVATGVWWHWLETGDRAFLDSMWPTVEAAVGFALRLQAPGGEILWSMDVDGHRGRFALLTASSSILRSLRCALAVAAEMGQPRPDWELGAARLAGAISRHVGGGAMGGGSVRGGGGDEADGHTAGRQGGFEPKDRWAMDWYYPVLSGALGAAAGRRRLELGWDVFVMPGLGVRCVSDHDWVTAAETAECVMALDAVGARQLAEELLSATRHLRDDDGAYATGRVHPQGVRFPGGERSTYSAAAVLLADHVLHGSSPTAGLFRLAGAVAEAGVGVALEAGAAGAGAAEAGAGAALEAGAGERLGGRWSEVGASEVA